MPSGIPKLVSLFILVLLLALVAPNFFILGQDNLAKICEEICQTEGKPASLSDKEYRETLEECQKYYEEKSREVEQDIAKTQKQKNTLQNEIKALQSKIKKLDNEIYQSNLMIKDLGVQIRDTEQSIEKTSSKIEDCQGKLTLILRTIYEEDQKSSIEILLSEEKLSALFNDLAALEVLTVKNKELLEDIKDLKFYLKDQKTALDNEEKELENVVIIRSLQKEENAVFKKEQEGLLQETEAGYQRSLKEKQETEERITKIGNLLFELLAVPEGGIKFEQAVEIAKSTSLLTGIRPAFSLAVLWQETKIGKLQGGCYLTDAKTGNGVYIKTGNKAPRTMKPGRDIPYFEKIVAELNQAKKLATDVFHTAVSCCMYVNGQPFGWGGAMGPAQFIPSTWMIYKEELEKKTGNPPANPWDVRDAFLANGLYLRDLGAGAKTHNTEINAALKYFGCTSSWCRTHYGLPVMTVADCCQDYIDNGSMSATCQEKIGLK